MKNRVLATLAGLATLASIAQAQEAETPLEEVVVIGSRIPRLRAAGPAPVTTIDAKQISADGLASIPDVLRSLTQNGGETQRRRSTGRISPPARSRWIYAASAPITRWCW